MPQALQLVGGGLSAYGSVSQGREARAAGEYNAEIEEGNATVARQAGEDRAQQLLRLGNEARSTTRNRASASGLVADTGSALLIQEEALYNAAKDAGKSRYAGGVQAAGHRQRARFYRIAGNNAYAAGFIGGTKSLLDLAAEMPRGMTAGGGMGLAGKGGGSGSAGAAVSS